jgi:hypothetical protein
MPPKYSEPVGKATPNRPFDRQKHPVTPANQQRTSVSSPAKFAACLNKPIDLIPDEVLAVLQTHDWPGNIRELQNFIERAVLFSPGSVLRLPLDLTQRVSFIFNRRSHCQPK